MLTESNKSVTFGAGYYPEHSVSADISNPLDAKLTYSHHIHSLDVDNSSIENDSADITSVSEGIDDSYRASSPQGCFTQPYYHVVYRESKTKTQDFNSHLGRTYRYDYDVQVCGYSGCDYVQAPDMPFSHSHNVTTTTNYDRWTTDANDHPKNRKETVYIRSCGLLNGQVTAVHVHYN